MDVSSIPAGTALVVVAHGSARPGWNERVIEAINGMVDWDGPKGVSFLSFCDEKQSPHSVIGELEKKEGITRIVVVPFLVSSFSNHYDEIRDLVNEYNAKAKEGAPRLVLTSAMDGHPLVTNILADELKPVLEADGSGQPRSLFLIAHGPNEDENNVIWMKHLETHSQRLKEQFGFLRVEASTLRDDAPDHIRDAATAHLRKTVETFGADSQVLVLPVLISVVHVQEVIQQRLANLKYTFIHGGLAKSPLSGKWVLQQLIQASQASA